MSAESVGLVGVSARLATLASMWLLTTIGFFSVVRKPGDRDLTVRARTRADLEALAESLPALGSIEEGTGTDYPYRARVSATELAAAIASMIEHIEYSNFKNEVATQQGYERARTYGQVWSELHELTRAERR